MEKSLSQVFFESQSTGSSCYVFGFFFKTTYGDVGNEFLGGEQGRVLAKVIYVVVSWSPATADH